MLIKELWVEANWRNGFRDEKRQRERRRGAPALGERDQQQEGRPSTSKESSAPLPGELDARAELLLETPSPSGWGRKARRGAGCRLDRRARPEAGTRWTQGCLIAARPDDIVLVSKQEKRRKRRKRHVFKSTPVSGSKPPLTRATYLPPERPQR